MISALLLKMVHHQTLTLLHAQDRFLFPKVFWQCPLRLGQQGGVESIWFHFISSAEVGTVKTL